MISALTSSAVDRGLQGHHISSVIVSMIALSGVDRGFETELRSKSKDWLARNQNNVCE